jgi:hypothetical protein
VVAVEVAVEVAVARGGRLLLLPKEEGPEAIIVAVAAVVAVVVEVLFPFRCEGGVEVKASTGLSGRDRVRCEGEKGLCRALKRWFSSMRSMLSRACSTLDTVPMMQIWGGRSYSYNTHTHRYTQIHTDTHTQIQTQYMHTHNTYIIHMREVNIITICLHHYEHHQHHYHKYQ